ncbi:MAG TPA: RodZ domain-containing protein [Anaerolineae bacterium]
MSDIGSQLQQAREARGLNLEQIQKATRIKRIYLEAIEANRFEDLPGPVQARGFVRSYAGHVGLDPDTLLARLDGVASAADARQRTAEANRPAPTRSVVPARSGPAPAPSPAPLPVPLPVLIIGTILLFAIGGFLLIRAFGGEAPAPTATLPPSAPLSISQAPEATPAIAATTGVSLTLTSNEHVWVRVSHDGLTAFEGILEPGQAQTWHGDQQIIVETGNGAALEVDVNGQPVGVLGPRNRVVVRAWGAEGEVTPAPTAIPSTPETPPTPSP